MLFEDNTVEREVVQKVNKTKLVDKNLFLTFDMAHSLSSKATLIEFHKVIQK